MLYNTVIYAIMPAPPRLKMADSKIYLNVPYAQKDEAKALGARWDATNKKWYAPANKDITLFVKWQTEALPSKSTSTTTNNQNSRTSAGKNSSTTDNTGLGVITYPTIKDFVAYDGDEPPWN